MIEQNDIKILRIKHLDKQVGKLKAFVDISLGDFVVKGLRIIEGKKGLFLGMPQKISKDNRWYKVFYPKTTEATRILKEVVLGEFKKD
jgi:stage V sporulation protein G